MKKFCLLILLFTLAVSMHAQNAAQARKILDKTAAVVGRKSGASANFTISGKYGNTSGTIAIKETNLMHVLLRPLYGMTERHNGHT